MEARRIYHQSSISGTIAISRRSSDKACCLDLAKRGTIEPMLFVKLQDPQKVHVRFFFFPASSPALTAHTELSFYTGIYGVRVAFIKQAVTGKYIYPQV